MFIKRKVRMFFVIYGKILLLSFIIAILFLLGLKFINNLYLNKTENYTENKIDNLFGVYEIKEKQTRYSNDIKIINKFIEYCINGEYNIAYAMLSDENKTEKYQTLDVFIDNYIKKIYNIQIVSYTYKIKENQYLYFLKQNPLSVGKDNSSVEQIFYVINENKIYIGKQE